MRILFLLILTSVFVACNGTPEQHELPIETWTISIENSDNTIGDVCATQNGGCAVVRESDGQTTVLMFDASGDQIRQANLAKYTHEEGRSICETRAGNLLVTGRVGTDSTDTYVAFISANDDTIRETRYDLGDASEIGMGITEAPDGSVYVCGQFNHRFGLLKLNQNFEFEWISFAGDSLSSTALALTMLPDGNVAVAGRSNDYGQGCVAVFDFTGNLLRELLLDDVSLLAAIAVTTDYEIVAAGNHNRTALLITLDMNLNLVRVDSDTSQSTQYVTDMVLSKNDLPTMLRMRFIDDYYLNDTWLSQWSLSGEIVWTRAFASSSDDYAVSLAACTDGGYFVYGYSYPSLDLFLYKVNEYGNF